MIDINPSNFDAIRTMVRKNVKLCIVPSASPLPPSVTRYGRYLLSGVDSDGDLVFMDDQSNQAAIDADQCRLMGMRVTPGSSTVSLEHIEHSIAECNLQLVCRLQEAQKALEDRYEFKAGDVVRFKHGLKDRKMPAEGQPAVVVRLLDNVKQDSQEGMGSHYSTCQYDMVVGIYMNGEFVNFFAESNRFEPYPQ